MNMIIARVLIMTFAAVGFLGAASSAWAVGLTDNDFAYLSTYDLDRTSPLIVSLSPKEQARLHALITDLTTASNPTARARDVAGALATFKKNQRWEVDHPGQLWDAPTKR